WYAGDVQKAVDMKLVNGVGNNKFNPTGLLTYSEVVKLAACMHQSYNTGEVTLKNGSPWYSTYVDYAKTNGIITKDYNWTQTVTRAGYMEIFSNALPDTALAPINEVPDGSIPDVAVNHPQAEDIYKLYRAGIVQGTNEQYYCKPDTSITRCEVATILVRMMDVDFRKHFVLIPIERPLGVLTQPKDATLPQSGSVTFTAAAYGGTAPYTYQWYRIPGGSMKYALSDNTYYQSTKTGTLTVKYNTDLGTGDMFYCVITDKAGATVTTSNANLTIGGPLNIKNQPKDIKTTLSGSASFTVTAIGGKEPYTYQWCEILYDGLSVVLSDNDKYSGAKTETLTGCNFTAAADYNAKYYCVVTDASGKSVTSKSATLTLTDAVAPMRITNHPESTSAPLGGSAIFVVAATDGKEPYTYSWRMRTAGGNAYVLHDIADSCIGTNSTTLLVKNLKMADNNAEFFCVVTDATGYWIQSKKATLTITGDTAPLTIITQPKSNSVPLSGTAVFSVAVTGGQPPYT
ncbi:MAG: S-layer homology domain-containing protein, partial [Ruminiclostridium sp.]|nr:S-layer homology domain-containing protein [Ruminiclostridium sp.]